MTVYLHGITICTGSDTKVVRFRKLNIPFKSLNELEHYRFRLQKRSYEKYVYTMHSFSKRSELFLNREELSQRKKRSMDVHPNITKIAYEYIESHSKKALAELLGMERKTLYSRLENHKWKKLEIFVIKRL